MGECGLDKFAGGRSPPGSGEPPDLELQDSIFRAQLALARELGRGVTVHCVKRVDAVAAAGGYVAYEKAHRAKLAAIFVPKLQRLPADAISHIVGLWAHTGWY